MRSTMQDFGLGKIPPQALELEEAILAAALLERDGLETLMNALHKPEVFYKESHKVIFKAMRALHDEGNPVDLLTIVAQLKRTGELEAAGGQYYIMELTTRVNSAAHIEHHTRIILEQYMKRLMIQLGQFILKNAFEDTKDVFDLIALTQRSLDIIADKLKLNPVRTGKDVVVSTLEQIEVAKNNKGISGITSGLASLDELTGGWQKGNMITLAGRTAMGKSAIALGLLRNAFLAGHSVAYFSLEMTGEELMNRLLSMEAFHSCNETISTSQISKGNLSTRESNIIKHCSQIFESDRLQIDDSSSLTIQEFRSKAISLKSKKKTELIVLDYLQLMTGDKGGNREQEVGSISRSIKQLAKELAIPIIALAQVNRAVEGKADKRPGLADLRESGSIEMDSNIVMFAYRPHYYGILHDENGNSTEASADLIISKNRNGPVLTLPIYYNSQVNAIKDDLHYIQY